MSRRVVIAGLGVLNDVTITQADIDALDLPSDTPRQSISSSVCMIYSVGN